MDASQLPVSRPIRSRPLTCLPLVLLSVLAALSGCSLAPQATLGKWWHNGLKVGPNYSPPAAPVAGEWIDYHDPRVLTEEQQLGDWWNVFGDPTLDSLVSLAYRQNLTLRTAGARILQAQAQRGVAVGGLFPQLQQGFGDYQRFKVSEETAFAKTATWFSDWDFGLKASWELDFWGRYRRAVEAADAELDASIEEYDDVLVLLLADVAASYIQYRTFEERLVYAERNIEIQTRAYELTMERFREGKVSQRDTYQAKQVLEQTNAIIPTLEIGKRQASNRLGVLLGTPPGNLDALLEPGAGIPQTPKNVVTGVPADLLRQRPDVRRAERQVAAQSARIGVAVSDLYPHISLLGTLGVQSEHVDNLFNTPGSMIGTVGPAVRWDLLNYGRLLNNIDVQDARFQELAYAYQDRVLNAGREVEDALVAFLQSQDQAEHLDSSVEAAVRTVEITNQQYVEGLVDFTPVYLFQTVLAAQQDQLATTRGEVALNLVRVYRSLGGGWQIRLPMNMTNSPPIVFDAVPLEERLPPPQPELEAETE